MKRRDFIKKAAAATGVVLCNPALPGLHPQASLREPKTAADQDVPDLDELAGGWMAADKIEQTPALANFHGSLLSSRNVLGVEDFTIPPFAQGGEMAALSINGGDIPAKCFRWFPYQIERKAEEQGLSILTTLRMPFEQCGILFSVEVANTSNNSRSVTLAIRFQAHIRRHDKKWTWETPRPGDKAQGEFDSGTTHRAGSTFLYTKDTQSESAAALVFVEDPHTFSPRTSSAAWKRDLEPGEKFSIHAVMAAGRELEAVVAQAAQWKERYPETWEASRTGWNERWLAAFKPRNNHFSGNLPTLLTPDLRIRRLYYSSVLSLLCLERTNLDSRHPRVFVTASPRWATTLVYFWDTSFFATLWALLDPAAMKQQLTLFLSRNIHSCYAIDFYSLEAVGPWYSANDYSIFRLVTTYIGVTGDKGFLDEVVQDNKQVIDYLEEMALHWRTLTTPPSLLADYGNASNLLETVPTYIERVPSMNAANVWMLRSAANMLSIRGKAERAHDLNELAQRLVSEVLTLYVDGRGFWSCLQADGKKVEVRHCIDFFTTIDTIKDDLGAKRIEQMTAFVNRELWTPHWLRALSLGDTAAKVADRADHGSTGSYDAWPALTAEAHFVTGRKAEALQRWRDVEPAIHEGPFGQAHYVATPAYPVRKAVSFGQDYFASASGAFAEVILRTVFGFSPKPEVAWSPLAAETPGFEGSLRNVRYGGRLLTLSILS